MTGKTNLYTDMVISTDEKIHDSLFVSKIFTGFFEIVQKEQKKDDGNSKLLNSHDVLLDRNQDNFGDSNNQMQKKSQQLLYKSCKPFLIYQKILYLCMSTTNPLQNKILLDCCCCHWK